jgi:ABC-type multidrug transport system fused ATPase/permease subunit
MMHMSPEEPTMEISVYGGKRDDVKESIERNLELTDESFYQTWLSVNVMKQLAFLFEGGVESSGGILEMIVMFVLVAIILAAFAFWQVVIFIIVILVLAIFSGGASFKFIRGTFIEADHTKIDLAKLDNFVKEQIKEGRFVKVESVAAESSLNEFTKKATRATRVFRSGIKISLIISTVFLIVEVAYRYFMGYWLTGLNPGTGTLEIYVLIIFGFMFLAGILSMDIGVLMRRNLSKSLTQS